MSTSRSEASPSKEKKLKPSSSLSSRGHYAFHISPSRTIYRPLPPSKFKVPTTAVKGGGGGAKKKKATKLDVFDFHSDDSDYEFDMPIVDYHSPIPVRATGKTSKTSSGIQVGQKRGRGRPKKTPKEPSGESKDDETTANESKPTSQKPTDRGQSLKTLDESSASEPGPCVDSTEELTPVVKRGRGRPRKTPKSTNESTPNVSIASEPGDSTGKLTPVVKRGRGRPRKTPKSTNESTPNVSIASDPESIGQKPVMRGRGPSKKIRREAINESTASESELVIESPAVKSESSSQQPVLKRGRGRPRKHPQSSPAVSNPSSQETVVKRGRGRPRKVVRTPNDSIGTITSSSTEQRPSTIETGDDEACFPRADAEGDVEDMEEEPVPTILDIIDKEEKGTSANNASTEEAQATTETTTIVITVPPDPTSFSSLYDIPVVLPPTTTDSDFTDTEGENTSNSVTVSVQEKAIPESEKSNNNNEQEEEEEGTNAMEPMQQGEASLSEEAPLVGTFAGSNEGDIGLTSDSSAKQNTSRAPSTVEQIKGAQTEPEIPVKPTTPVKRTSSTSSTGSTPVKEAAPMSEAAPGLPVPLAKSVSDTSSYKVKQDSVQYSVTLPKTKSNKPDIPTLSRSLTWPKASEEKQSEDDSTVTVRNVRQAHECLQHGENLRFRDDVIYLLDSMKTEEPLLVRCLSTLNLAEQCLNVDFMRQMRSLGLVKKSLLLLKDAQTQPALKVAMVTLSFVMIQSNVEPSELDKKCRELLVMALSAKDELVSPAGEEQSLPLEGKAATEYKKITDKSKALLKKCSPLLIHAKYSESGNPNETIDISLQPSTLSLGELATECFLSLTSSMSTSVSSLKEDLRTLGAIDVIANRAIALTRQCTGYLTSGQEEEEGEEGEEREVDVHFMKLFRQLKLLENILCMSKGNQSYLTMFEGSIFISEISKFLVLLGDYLISKDLSTRHTFIVTETLLGTLRVFLNITHDNALASYRVGQQEKIIDSICNFTFKLAQSVPVIQQFDILVLCLSLLINLLEEESSTNVEHMASVFIDVTSTSNNPYGDMLATQALVKLFLTHYERGESASVEVPTPTKKVISHESPAKSPKARKDLTSTFTSRMKSGIQPVPKKMKQREEEKMEEDKAEGKEQEEEEEEEEEDDEDEEGNISFDPLIFKREDFDSALSQAGKHMEDSIISSYSAVLVALLIQNDSEFALNVKNKLPDGNFSSLIKVLKEFLSFMNMASSGSTRSGLESVQRILKFLSAMD